MRFKHPFRPDTPLKTSSQEGRSLKPKELFSLFKEAASEWSDDNATRLGAAVAFYSILSLAPLLILAVAVAGMVFGEEAARGELVGQMRGLVGDAGADVVQTLLANAKRPAAGVIATIVGLVTLLFGASGVFSELHEAMNSVWNVRTKPGRGVLGFLKDKIFAFGLVLSVGFLLLISLIVSALLSAFGGYLEATFAGLPIVMQAINQLVGFGVITGLFALLFRFLPDVRAPWRGVFFGAAFTAFMFTIGKYLIGLYLSKTAVGTPFGAAGSLVALVVWIYYSALIVFFGAELTQVHVRRTGARIRVQPNAEQIPPTDALRSLLKPHAGKS